MQHQGKHSIMIAAGLSLVMTLTACGGDGTDKTPAKEGAATSAKKEAPTEINIMSTFYSQEPPGDDNIIIKEAEKRTNTKLKITWVSSNNYTDKQNVTLASGNIPDLMLVMDPFAPNVVSMGRQGAFWDISPLIKNYPNLSQFPEVSWSNIKSEDGKIYGIPRVRPTDGQRVLFVREDWLKKLNLKTPETLDDVYKVMKAFTENDPDGNSKKDTFGFTANLNATDMGYFDIFENTFNNSNGKWKLKDGQLVDTVLEPGTKQAIEFLAKAYQEGLIPPDFAVLKNNQAKEMLASNRAGMGSDAINAAWTNGDELRKTMPDADFYPLPSVTGPNGKFVAKSTGFFGVFLIPKKVPEATLKKILEFMDYGASEEGGNLADYGLKDTHYTEQGGIKTATPQAAKDNVSPNAFGQIFKYFDKYFRAYAPGITAAKMDRNKKIIDEQEKISTGEPHIGLVSDTNIKLGSDYAKKIMELKIAIIMGKEKLDAWDAFVAKLKADPEYQKIIKEMNDAYKKKAGK
jgi:putative aldouronate transport system substrate-binding protein